MSRVPWIAACLLVVGIGRSSATPGDYYGVAEPTKRPKMPSGKSAQNPAQPPRIQVGGDTFGTSTPIPALPYTDSGNTCSFSDDYSPVCASFGVSTAPDVVYSFTPQANTCVGISLCGSQYDTVLHVYDGVSGLLVACNDDACDTQSRLEGVQLAAGVTYYIVVDGWDTGCGDYTLSVTQCAPPCTLSCPPGSQPESEPVCGSDYIDRFNGGCNSSPPAFSSLPGGAGPLTVCGQYGTFVDGAGNDFRDTDWYPICVDVPTAIDFCVTGEAPTQIAILNGSCSPPLTSVCGSVYGSPCQTICCQAVLNPGAYWLFVAPSTFSGVACSSNYVMTIDHTFPCVVGVTPADWGGVKILYR